MKRKVIVLLGVFLASHLSAAAQTRAPRIVAEQDRVAPSMAMVPAPRTPLLAVSLPLPGNPEISALRTVPAPLPPASFPRPKKHADSAAHFSYVFARPYHPDQGLDGLENMSQMSQVDTLFLKQSSLPLVQIWGGRLRFDGFARTLDVQNVQLGPSAGGGLQDFRPWRQGVLGAPPSEDSYGISMTFHFGRDAQVGRPAQIWRTVARAVGSAQ
jgi:hypothetical protein